jgi:DHA1 family tetracycline resistance protein-like MFS transporter
MAFGLLGVHLLYLVAHDSNPSIFSYYTMFKFEWSERDVGYALGFVGAMITLVQGLLISHPQIGGAASCLHWLSAVVRWLLGVRVLAKWVDHTRLRGALV